MTSKTLYTEVPLEEIGNMVKALREMARYLPVIENAERHPAIWEMATEGTGIATANAYRQALTNVLVDHKRLTGV